MKKYTLFFLLISLLACQEAPATKKAIIPAKVEKQAITAAVEPSIKEDAKITIDYIMGKFDPKKHPDFVLVNPPHSDGNSRYLHKDTWAAFKKMYEAAKKDGVTLQIRSATRNFQAQKGIWEAKWTGKRLVQGGENLAKSTPNPDLRAIKILRWSSMPGSSRHHWGTDIDINAFENDYFDKGKGLKEYTWLVKNGPSFGFCQPYSPKDKVRPHGYNEEKWHWSYLPLATQLSDQAKLRLKDSMIQGFKGAQTATTIGVVEKYVLGINADCL